jgi:hypothetical protein
VILLLLAGLELGWPQSATAHDLFTAYIQHSVHLAVGAKHVDLTLDLTFFEEWSARERLAMDADADGRITRAEIESYLKRLAPELAKQVKLRVASREVPLAPLYDPELDLLGNDKAIPGHHRLRLFFFAPTPATLRANDEFVIEDRLWPEAKMLATVVAEGRDGAALEAEQPSDPGLAPLRPGEAWLFKIRCLKPPETKPATHRPAATNSTQSTSNPRVR